MKKTSKAKRAKAVKSAKRRGDHKAAEKLRRHERIAEGHKRPLVPNDGRVLIVAPKRLKFAADNWGSQTIRMLRRLYVVTVEQRQTALIDLFDLAEASVPTLTVLMAEISRCLEIAPDSIRGIAPKDPIMHERLDRFGVLAALGLPASGSNPTTVLRIRTGLAPEIRRTEFLDRFLDPVFPGNSPLKGRVKGAITEALLNIVDHAYPPEVQRPDLCPSARWWIAGQRNLAGNRLWFCVYDLGVGLPATLPRSRSSAIRDAIAQMTGIDQAADHKMIKLAVHTSLSQTGAQGRGRGLREMARLVDRAGEGALWIFSRDGTYLYGRGSKEQDSGDRIPETFAGTLIVWTFELTDAVTADIGGVD
jgi:hypothetical protein